jgi:hypothetical protein
MCQYVCAIFCSGIVFLFSLGWVVDSWTCWGSRRSPATYAVGKDISSDNLLTLPTGGNPTGMNQLSHARIDVRFDVGAGCISRARPDLCRGSVVRNMGHARQGSTRLPNAENVKPH